jgi:hypothetical protein
MRLVLEDAMAVTVYRVNLDMPWISSTLPETDVRRDESSVAIPLENVTICWGSQEISLLEIIE